MCSVDIFAWTPRMCLRCYSLSAAGAGSNSYTFSTEEILDRGPENSEYQKDDGSE